MTVNEPVFKAFNDFGIDDMPTQAEISRRMLWRLEDIDNATTAGPLTLTARGPRIQRRRTCRGRTRDPIFSKVSHETDTRAVPRHRHRLRHYGVLDLVDRRRPSGGRVGSGGGEGVAVVHRDSAAEAARIAAIKARADNSIGGSAGRWSIR
jgi:hypothetical protein